jgi:predicted ATPase
MRLTSIALENWKNFRSTKFDIGDRLFVVGANASGKSNLLDALRFMHDIVKSGGGLRYAVAARGGIEKIRCLSAEKTSHIAIGLDLLDDNNITWTYKLAISQQSPGSRNAMIQQETVFKDGKNLVDRPNTNDKADIELLTQTYLEQTTTNKDFRDMVRFLEDMKYTHLVPQFLKHPEAFNGNLPEDPFGKDFLRTIADAPEPLKYQWLEKINEILRTSLPHPVNLKYDKQKSQPHLAVTYKYSKNGGAGQNETDLSDGTLRLIGLLWSILDGKGLLLLEEPELSLHTSVVEKLAGLFYSIQCFTKQPRQLIITTHSAELLSDRSISLSQILLLKAEDDNTKAEMASDEEAIIALLKGGLNPAEAVLPYTRPIYRTMT